MKKTVLLLICLALLSCVTNRGFQPQKTVITYSFNTSSDMDGLFDFTATYVDKDNQTVHERITSSKWKKQITVPTPFNAHLDVVFSAKDQIPNQATYKVGFNGLIEQSNKKPAASTIQTRADDPKLRFSITLPPGVSPDDVNLSIAPLKYDKHFAFTFTVDDAYENAWSRIFLLTHKKWIDETEFFHLGNTPTTGYIPEHTLSMTDGCGNERRFGFGVAIWPTYRNSYNKFEPRMQETSKNSIYITWEELRVMLDFGCSVYLHNVDETKYDKTDPAQILQGFQNDYNKVIEKLGRKMKVLALPDGNKAYIEAAKSFPQVEFARNSTESQKRIYLNNCGSLKGGETYGGNGSQATKDKIDEIAKQAASANPYWLGMTVHRASKEHMEALMQIYNLYGKAGADNIWAASWDEIYEYQEFRYGSTISKSIDGQTATFEISVPDCPDYTFRELSFIADGIGIDCPVTPTSGNIYGMSHAIRNGKMLINVNFDPQLPKIAEKYTAKYEVSVNEADKDDARYFASMLLPNLAAPLIDRIENRKDRLSITSVTINDGANTVYDKTVKIALTTTGNPTFYRIGETPELSAATWKPYSPELSYTLSSGFSEKTIFLQVGNGVLESDAVSASISYSDIPENGTISRDAVKAYQSKYNGHKISIDKKITAN